MKHAKIRIFPLLSLVLVGIVMLTFVGCGNEATSSMEPTTSTTTGTTTATQTVESSATTTTTEVTSATVTDATATTATEATTTTVTTVRCTAPPTYGHGVPDELSGQRLKMFIWWTATNNDQGQTAEFKKYTGIQVAFETCSVAEYQSQLSAKIMANNAPAVAAIRSEWYPQPITRGLMQPIENTGWDYSNRTDDIYATDMMDQFAYKGKHYGVALKGSLASDFMVMYFNKDVLKAKGVKEDPYELWKKGQWNWNTCLSIAKQCTDVKNDRYGITTLANYYWMLSADQDLVLSESDGLKNNAKAPEVLDAWVHALDMMLAHQVSPVDFTQQSKRFSLGMTAMLGANSDWMKTDADGINQVTFDWGVAPFPSPKGQTPVAACEGVVWGFPDKVTGDTLQAAMWWLRYYLDDSAYGNADVYPKNACWEVMRWMSSGQVRSLNSVGVLCYGGECDPRELDNRILLSALIDESVVNYRAVLRTTLGSVYSTLQQNIAKIENEL